MSTKAEKSSRKNVANRLYNKPNSAWKAWQQLDNHLKREKSGLEPKRLTGKIRTQ